MWPQALETEPVREVLERAGTIESSTLRLFGIPESEIAQTLREIEADTDLSELEITTCLRRAELHVDIRHRPGADDAVRALREGISERHGSFLFSEDGSSIDEQVAALLREGHRVGLAESCTAGLLASRLSEPPGASGYFAGGVVAYSNDAKRELLRVPERMIEQHGAVSNEVAEAMADGALLRFNADVGVGITGIAGPGGGTEEKPVGYVCICVKGKDGTKIARDPVLPGDRGEIKDRAATVAMHLMRRLLRGEDFPI
jgi:nicotinamide-nucleotide amidase